MKTYLTDEDLIELLTAKGDHNDGATRLASTIMCARRSRLDDAADRGGVLEENKGRDTGTITHKIFEHIHLGHRPEEYVATESENAHLHEMLQKAWTLGDRYQERFPAGFWGECIGAELSLESEWRNGRRRHGTLDAVFCLDEAAIDRIEEIFGVHLNGPGNYVWDLKTAGQKDNLLDERYAWHPQTFQNVWLAEMHGLQPRGMLYFKAVTYKTERQERFFLTCHDVETILSDEGYARFEHQLLLSQYNIANDVANSPNACTEWNKVCPHRMSGDCDGY